MKKRDAGKRTMKRPVPIAVRLMADLPFPAMFAVLSLFAVALGIQGYRFFLIARLHAIDLALLEQATPLLLLLAVVALLGWALAESVNTSIAHLSAAADRIAQGQLDVDMDFVCREELRRIRDSFAGMAVSMRQAMRNVRDHADAVLQSAQEVAQASAAVADASHQQSQAAAAMAEAVGQGTVSIEQIADSMETVHGIAGQAGELSQQGCSVSTEAAAQMREIVAAVEASAAAVRALDQRAGNISAVVEMINGIADQTTLLALNAAIEAARAGEHGRGFAVVADEVRKLADTTGRATEEIKRMIAAIQQETRQVAAGMGRHTEQAGSGLRSIEQASAAMASLQADSSRLAILIQQISRSVHEQEAASIALSHSIEQIAHSAEENAATVQSHHAVADRLERLAAGLRQEVGRFQLDGSESGGRRSVGKG
jgi:methyl-accepting chemotaxis protein